VPLPHRLRFGRFELVPGAHYFEDAPKHREQVADLMAGWIQARI